jgi:hypothetical protein
MVYLMESRSGELLFCSSKNEVTAFALSIRPLESTSRYSSFWSPSMISSRS